MTTFSGAAEGIAGANSRSCSSLFLRNAENSALFVQDSEEVVVLPPHLPPVLYLFIWHFDILTVV